VHALIASGALAADGSRWIAGGSRFLFPVHGLSRMFRAKFLNGLAELFADDALDLPPHLATLLESEVRRRFLADLRAKPWVVYSKRPFAGPRKLVDYLGRYTHRVAIANHRLLSCQDGQVRFSYRDRTDGDRPKIATIPVDEFLGRFLKHVLPERFQRIRHYGLLANRGKHERLKHCRELLGVPPQAAPATTAASPADWLCHMLGVDPDRCPCCGDLLQREVLEPQPPRMSIAAPVGHAVSRDTS
jgi:hypothetical protein